MNQQLLHLFDSPESFLTEVPSRAQLQQSFHKKTLTQYNVKRDGLLFCKTVSFQMQL